MARIARVFDPPGRRRLIRRGGHFPWARGPRTAAERALGGVRIGRLSRRPGGEPSLQPGERRRPLPRATSGACGSPSSSWTWKK